MVGSAVCVLFVAMSFAFFEANANMQSLHLESRSVVRHRRSILNDAEKAEVLKAHNDVRRKEGASNMEIMLWNDDLATMAEAWAQKCQWYHGQAIDPPPSLGYDVVGQNLYAVSGAKSINITDITLEWYNEKPYYNDDSKDCQPNTMCRHYTQVVWASTNMIGCAYVTCPTLNTTVLKNAIFFACNYAPPGNYLDQSPFNSGPKCSACASGNYWCNGGLCDGSCVSGKSGCDCYVTICENSGTLNSDRCACECPSCYCGSDCSRTCSADPGPDCGCAVNCQNGGSKDDSTCKCKCSRGWGDIDCSNNGLSVDNTLGNSPNTSPSDDSGVSLVSNWPVSAVGHGTERSFGSVNCYQIVLIATSWIVSLLLRVFNVRN